MQNRRRLVNAVAPAPAHRVRNGMPWCFSRQHGRARVVLCVAAATAEKPAIWDGPSIAGRSIVEPTTRQSVRDFFHDFARHTADRLGSPWAFFVAIGTVIVWACLGPRFGFSGTWQLVINTGTTIVTFL